MSTLINFTYATGFKHLENLVRQAEVGAELVKDEQVAFQLIFKDDDDDDDDDLPYFYTSKVIKSLLNI